MLTPELGLRGDGDGETRGREEWGGGEDIGRLTLRATCRALGLLSHLTGSHMLISCCHAVLPDVAVYKQSLFPWKLLTDRGKHVFLTSSLVISNMAFCRFSLSQ